MQRILLVSEEKNAIANSLASRLDSLGYAVIHIANRAYEIEAVKIDLDLILI